MSDEKLNDTLRSALPQSLDEIVTKNRDIMQLMYATAEDLDKINANIPVTNLKGNLTDAFIYKRIVPSKNKEVLCLVGFKEGQWAYHTSEVVAYDVANNVALTGSGSHYVVKNIKTESPDLLLLLHICYMFHRDGIGNYFGAAPVFY
jgi:hypothetical protein